jgi:outer membrane protein with beta-barrel domain
MKKITILLTFCFAFLAFSCGFSQSTKVGFQMGASFSKMNFTGTSEGYDQQKSLIAPRLGFLVDIPVYDNFFISSGVFTTAKGFRFDSERFVGDVVEYDGEWFDTKESFLMVYLDIPVNFGYKYDLGGVKVYGKTGPYMGINMYSTLLYKYDGSNWDNEKITIGEANEETDAGISVSKMDFGWNIEAGVEYDRLQVSFYYSLGFSNVQYIPSEYKDEFDDGSKMQNRIFGINVAVLFGQVDGGGRGRRGYRR